MEDSKEGEKDFDKIKVFSSDDEKLKMLGELLSNKSSRDIIRLLSEKEMYTNEIADNLKLRPNLVIHHLKKLEDLKLLEINYKKILKKGKDHRYFRMTPHLFISTNQDKDRDNKKGIKYRFFKEGVKFAVITIAVITSLFTSTLTKVKTEIEPKLDGTFGLSDITNKTTEIIKNDTDTLFFNFLFIPIIIISSLFLIWFSNRYR